MDSRDRGHHDVQAHGSGPSLDEKHLDRRAWHKNQEVVDWVWAIRQFAGLVSLVNSELNSNWLEQVWELPTA